MLAARRRRAEGSSAGDEQLTALLPIAWTDLVAPAPFPLLGALVAAITARLTAMSVLARRS